MLRVEYLTEIRIIEVYILKCWLKFEITHHMYCPDVRYDIVILSNPLVRLELVTGE
jgi:hypothetical protein